MTGTSRATTTRELQDLVEMSKLTSAGNLSSASPKSPVRLAFPLDYRERLFQNLFANGDPPE